MKVESSGRVGMATTLTMGEIERLFISEVERRAGASRGRMLACAEDKHTPEFDHEGLCVHRMRNWLIDILEERS